MSGAAAPPWDEKSVVQSVFKALALLEAFTPGAPELTVAELSSRTGLNKGTCSRLVATMVHAGWLQRLDGGRVAPTMKVLGVAAVALGRLDVREEARPVLRDLAQRFGDTGYLMVPDGPRAVCLDKVEGDHPVRVNVTDIGSSLPLHVAAAPLVLLAHRPELLAALDDAPLERFTDGTTTARPVLEARLADVRAQGYAVSAEDYLPGVAAVGAPVFDRTGTVVAAVSLGGVAERFAPPRRDEIVAGVVDAARAISASLGADA
ncbi:IclR family transcriptional regulator [Patulibacter sp. S7RM1-6]